MSERLTDEDLAQLEGLRAEVKAAAAENAKLREDLEGARSQVRNLMIDRGRVITAALESGLEKVVTPLEENVRELARQRDGLKADLAMASGTIHAQDERERRAGERCGVAYDQHGCDWPDAMAEEVLRLRAERNALKARLEKEGA